MLEFAHQRARTLVFALPFALLFPVALHAAPQVWIEELDGPQGSSLRAADGDGAGGFFLAGGMSSATDKADALVQRRQANGLVVWSRTLASPAPDHAQGIAADGAGGVFVVGGTEGALGGAAQGMEDAFVARFDGNGNLDWVIQLGTSTHDRAIAAAADGTGGVFVTGRTGGSLVGQAQGFTDVWLARFDSSGELLWSYQFGSGASDDAWAAAADGLGGVFLSGSSMGSMSSTFPGHAWCARFDGAGQRLFLRQYGSPLLSSDGAFVAADGAGGAFLAGSIVNASESDLAILHLDGAGGVLWARQHDLESSDRVLGIAADGSGGTWICGDYYVDEPIFQWGDAFVVHIDDQGDASNDAKLSGPGVDSAVGVLAVGPFDVIAVGSTDWGLLAPTYTPDLDGWVARLGACDFETPASYCVALPNSTGVGAIVDSAGTRYLANDDFALTVRGCPPGEVGLFLMGQSQASMPFGDGVLCLGGTVLRLMPPVSIGASGSATLHLDFADPSSSASQIGAGETWNFQFWYRDTASTGAGFNLSNGLSATFCP